MCIKILKRLIFNIKIGVISGGGNMGILFSLVYISFSSGLFFSSLKILLK